MVNRSLLFSAAVLFTVTALEHAPAVWRGPPQMLAALDPETRDWVRSSGLSAVCRCRGFGRGAAGAGRAARPRSSKALITGHSLTTVWSENLALPALFGGKEMMTAQPHRRRSKRRTERDDSAERDRLEKALEIGLEDTFPASDAVAVVQPSPTA
jgi:hypothetical protein